MMLDGESFLVIDPRKDAGSALGYEDHVCHADSAAAGDAGHTSGSSAKTNSPQVERSRLEPVLPENNRLSARSALVSSNAVAKYLGHRCRPRLRKRRSNGQSWRGFLAVHIVTRNRRSARADVSDHAGLLGTIGIPNRWSMRCTSFSVYGR